jgi:hypothetical protein
MITSSAHREKKQLLPTVRGTDEVKKTRGVKRKAAQREKNGIISS